MRNEIQDSGATITASEAARLTWDAVVIGAGPAGAVVACELARHSKSVLLVERQCWPRAKACGGCLNERAVKTLTALGLERAIKDAHGAPVHRLRVQCGRNRAEIPLFAGVAISRAPFDAALVRAAIDVGAAFLPETTARVARQPVGGNARRIELQSRDHSRVGVEGRVILAADGLGHPSLSRLSEFDNVVAARSRVGLAVTLDDATESPPEGTISMAISPAGYVGLARTADRRVNLAAAVDRDAVARSGGPAALTAEIMSHAGMCRWSPEPNAAWRATPLLTQRSSQLVHDRIFVLGDAAGYVEPFTGEGMAWAIHSAVMVAPWAIQEMNRWTTEAARHWNFQLSRARRENQRLCRILAAALRRPRLVRGALWMVGRMPSVARPWVRRVQARIVGLEPGVK